MQETREMWVWSLDQEDSLEKEMATHSSILAWEISQTEEPGRLQATGSQIETPNWLNNSSNHRKEETRPEERKWLVNMKPQFSFS